MNPASRKRILVADDDPGIRTALRATLEAAGYDVDVADDGRRAIDALASRPFDLAILDLAMPYLDGLEVLKELKSLRGADAMPPVIVLTAHGSVSAAIESGRSGAVDFLLKPVSPDSLRAAIRRAMAQPGPLVDHGENYFG